MCLEGAQMAGFSSSRSHVYSLNLLGLGVLPEAGRVKGKRSCTNSTGRRNMVLSPGIFNMKQATLMSCDGMAKRM